MGAPTTKIETFVVTSPLKINALICALISFVLLLTSLFTDNWLTTHSVKQGLWRNCTLASTIPSLAYTMQATHASASFFVCIPINNILWIQVTAGLIALSLACAIISVVTLTMGLNHNERQEKKVRLYNAALFSCLSGFVSIVCGLVLFPFMFIREFDDDQRENWYFGWSYGVAVGAAIFYAGAIILLGYDRKREEVFYRERLYINQEDESENFEVNQESKIKASRP